MSEPNRCPECGAELPSGALGGLCPKCLLGAGLESRAEPAHEGSGSEAPTTPHSGSFVPPDAAWLAAHFPQLEILELLGHGGMGAVYKARQPKLDRMIALKIIRPESAHDPAFAERFNREARMLARLAHPNIVVVYDFGSVDISLREMNPHADFGELSRVEREDHTEPQRLYFFLMEYVDGMNLRQLLQTGELLPEQALAIVPQICEALQFAHSEGVVHRDIKPENILLDKRGRVKIADFGLAKLAASSPQDFTLTGTHQVMGTPRYMAPEQMEGSHAVDHRADIYSLGVVFYEMLTGEVPMGHFEPPSKRVEIDVRLDEVVLRTLAREPERRYQHASDVRTDVNSIITPTGPVRPIEPGNVAWTYWKPSWQAYAAYSMVFALLLHSLVAAVYGNRFLWNNTVVLATLATILVTSCLAYLIEKLRFDVRMSWRDPRNLLTLVLGFVMMLVTVLLPSPVELKDWLPSTTQSLTERDERYLRILALGLSLWTFYFTAAHVWFALGWLIRRPQHIGPKSGEPKNDAKLRPRAVSGEIEQTGASAVANPGSAAEPYPGVLRLVQNPAWGLIITGIISWVTIPLAFAVPFTANMNAMNAMQRAVFQISFGAIPLVVGTIMALAGFRMKRLEGYRVAMFAAVLPIAVLIFKLVGLSFGTLAIGPADLVGAPVGLWVLVILTRSDVKEVFRSMDSRIVKAAPFPFGFATIGFLAAGMIIAVAIVFGRQRQQSEDGAEASTAVQLAAQTETTGQITRQGAPRGESSKSTALFFDGRDDYVEIAGLTYDGSYPITIELRAKPASHQSYRQLVLISNFDYSEGQDYGISLFQRGDTYPRPTYASWAMAYSAINKHSHSLIASAEAWKKDRQSHIAFVADGRRYRFYLDGELWRHGELGDSPAVSTKPFRIGGHPFLKGYFHGTLDEVRISTSARYEDDFSPALRFETDENTVALYHFDDARGDRLVDSSGNDHHGMIVGAKWVPEE